ncbi:MAG TPA: inverse autotransporter beta domain-containing protein [Candidatus Saccharimonadia bacterium]|nr:inverse autotransporter beta domain-containing protein [Candidatus Saccharimonadia bacterium]
MKLFSVIIAIFCCMVVPLQSGPVEKNPQVSLQPVHEAWTLPLLGTGVKSNDAYTDGHIFLNVPLWSTIGADGTLGGSYLFLEPYTSVGEGGENASSLGIGFRHLFNDQPVSALNQPGRVGFMEEGWYIGGSLFVDMLRTEHRNEFWQLGFGAEIGTRYLELRGNYYLPLEGGRKGAGSQVDRETFTSSSTRRNTSSSASDPFATGNLVVQDATTTTTATTTFRTTTLTRTTQFYERGMEGWDIEAGILIPGLDEYMDVKIVGGYASMENQPYGPQERGTGPIRGWRAGLEVRPVPAVVLTGLWHENKAFTGSDWSAGIELQIPLDRTWKDAFKPRRRHLVERMAEPVHRQNAAIKLSHSAETKTESKTSVKRVTKVVAQSSQRIVLEDDIIFVNNGAPVGNGIQAGNDAAGNGTAEAPKASMQIGADVAQANSIATGRVWNVYTQGTAAGYTEDVQAHTGSVNFIGSGRRIQGLGGKSFGKGPAPLLTGGIHAQSIPFFGVTGYRILNGLSAGPIGVGVRINDVSQYLVDGNGMTGMSYGVVVTNGGTSESAGLITRNTISTDNLGIAFGIEDTAVQRMTVLDNSLFNNVLSDVAGSVSGTLHLDLGGNRFANSGSSAVHLVASLDGVVTMATGGNSFQNTGTSAYELDLTDDSVITAVIADDLFTNIGNHGVDVEADENARVVLSVLRNTMTNVTGDGISLLAEEDSLGLFGFHRNSFSQITGQAIDVELTGSADAVVFANLNTITAANRGLRAITRDDSGLDIAADFNVIVNSTNTGMELRTGDNSHITGVLTGNYIQTPVNQAFVVVAGDSSTLTATISRSTIVSPGTHGLHSIARDDGELLMTFSNNTVSNPGEYHALMSAEDNGLLSSLMYLNTFTTTGAIPGGGLGMRLLSSDSAGHYVEAYGNTITDLGPPGSDSAGIHATASDGSQMYALIGQNVISNVYTNSLTLQTEDTAGIEGIVAGNTVTGTQAVSGIRLESGGVMDVSVIFNLVQNGGAHGITLRTVGGQLDADVSHNTVLNSAQEGILFQSTLGDMSVLNFDANRILGAGDAASVMLFEEAGTTMTIYGTPGTGNNIMDDSALLRVWDVNNSVEGIFHIGAPVNADRLDNTSVP